MKTFIRPILILIGGALVCFLAIQLIPIAHTNPPVVTQVKWDSPQTQALFMRACGDCHSNQTIWPWYSYVAPVSWLVARDVYDGRRRLDISDMNSGRFGFETGRLTRVIETGSMPPIQYLILHPNASLSASEKQTLISGLQATFSTGSVP